MRIGFDAKRYFHNSTGLGQYSRSLIRALTTYYPDKYVAKLLSPGNIPTATGRLEHLKVNAWQRNVHLGQLNSNIDLYHGLSNQLPYYPSKQIPQIVTIHDLIFMRFPGLYKSIDRKIYSIKTKRACAKADLILSISEQTKEDLITRLDVPAVRIKTIYQSADPIYYADSVLVNPFEASLPAQYILYVGGLAGRKNGLSFLKAYARLSPTERLPVVFAGSDKNSLQASIQQCIAKNKLEPYLTFLGYVNTLNLKALYRSALWTVYPSAFEGFGVPAIESLCNKTPVICADIASLPEAAGPGGLYFNIQDDNSLLEQLNIALRMSDLDRKTLGDKGYRYVMTKTHPKVFAEAMDNVYQSFQ